MAKLLMYCYKNEDGGYEILHDGMKYLSKSDNTISDLNESFDCECEARLVPNESNFEHWVIGEPVNWNGIK